MTMFETLLGFYPEYGGAGGREAMVRDGMACPAQNSVTLLGYEQVCEAEKKTPGMCRACQRQFLMTEAPVERMETDWDNGLLRHERKGPRVVSGGRLQGRPGRVAGTDGMKGGR